MRPQTNRLPAAAAKGFSGSAIDRNRPIRFGLDGRLMSGFVGDTVLSAVLASGVDTIGVSQGSPVGLTSRAYPAIRHASLANDPRFALPMDRTPALDGAEFVTCVPPQARGLARLFQPGRTLGRDLDTTTAFEGMWKSGPAERGEPTDLLVVGGGVAGLSAALAATRAGLSVTLVESRPFLGGYSGLFGTLEGEDSPEESMSRLGAEVLADSAISVLTSAAVFSVRPGLARLHQVEPSNGQNRGRVVDIPAARIVIATGSIERLPIFAGNRLPGVTGSLDAYELVTRFGVWPGRNAILATATNPAYRLAMLASDAGIEIGRILDSRPHSASRFIAFSRAYGMVQSPGATIASVGVARAGGTLSVHVEGRSGVPLVTDRLLVSGGWQPDLTLWHIAGGASQWQHESGRIEPRGDLDGIALAGSAAGYFSRRGCIQSGADAVDKLLGRPRRQVDDPTIDPIYETPDGPLAIAAPDSDTAPAYLDGGPGLLQRPVPPRRRPWQVLWRSGPSGLTLLSEAPQPLSVTEVAAGVELDLIPEGAAGIVAQERVASIPLASEQDHSVTDLWGPVGPGDVPPYLAGRFGPDAKVVRLLTAEPRALETGALIFPNSDTRHPREAIGVVLRFTSEGPMALVSSVVATAGLPVVVRDKGQIVPATAALQAD